MNDPRTLVNEHGLTLHVGGVSRSVETADSHPHLFTPFGRYVSPLMPTPPDSFDWSVLSLDAQGDILKNDALGDCTAAAAAHLIAAWTSCAGDPVQMTADQTQAFYSASTGYDPSDPTTDRGGSMIAVLTRWRDFGFDGKGGHAITGWLAVDPTNWDHVRLAAYLFGGLYAASELAPAWSQISGSGFTWDVGQDPDPKDGHCYALVGGDPDTMKVSSWGMLGAITRPAVAQFCASENGGALFAPLSPDIISRATLRSPTSLDWATLRADVQALGGLST